MDEVVAVEPVVESLQAVLTSSGYLESTLVGFAYQDTDGVILDCNDSAVRLFATTRSEVIGHKFSDLEWTVVRDDGVEIAETERTSRIAIDEGRGTSGTIVGIDHSGRLRRWLLVNSEPASIDGKIVGVISSFVDVTDQVQREHSLQLVNTINRMAMDTVEEHELFQRLCDSIVGRGNYSLAWIGVESDTEEGVVNQVGAAGVTDYLYEDIVSTLSEWRSGQGPTGSALQSGVTQVANDLSREPRYDTWRTRAASFGLRSAVAIPFRVGGCPAALSIYHRQSNAFNDVVIYGFEEITREIERGVAYQRSVLALETTRDEASSAIGALQATEKSRAESEQRFRLAFENNMAPMVFSDLDDLAIGVNDAFCEMIGFTREELLGHDSQQFTLPEDMGITEETHARLIAEEVDQIRYSKRYLRKDGRIIISEVSRSAARDETGEILYFVSSERDVTEERALTIQLSHQALHDPLTGLANRALFDDRLTQARARVDRLGGLIAVLLLDLDDFKGVNDTHGHLVGDQLLIGIARRFELVTRSQDTLSRFGGDEFLYLAEGLTSPSEAGEVARRLLDVLAEPFAFGGLQFEQHASVGIVTWDVNSDDSIDFIQNADVALYEAKREQRGGYSFFTQSMHHRAATRFTLLQELRQSLQAGELSMHYQPIVDLRTSRVVGFEALMRWQHPRRGNIPPSVFIPLAEQSDMILELGSLALHDAVAAASSWRAKSDGTGYPYVTVNLAAHQFHDPGLVAMVQDALSTGGLPSTRLIIEITEGTALFDVAETLRAMSQLRRLGINIALDDFGTGYSSLSYLMHMHPTIIKIDQSFVRPSEPSADNDALLETIISLGQKLGVTMLAEGIETNAQLEQLRGFGCDLGQGFLFSPAVPASQVAAIIDFRAGSWG